MKIDVTTCWYNDTCPEQMIKGAKGILWPVLEKSDHFPVLDLLMQNIDDSCLTMLDIGCGAAELSRIYSNYFYVGADLKNIILDVSMKMHPEKRYISFDIYKDDCKFVADYDIVVMNAFIDILEYPIFGLEAILKHAKKYIILHRQEIDNNLTRVIKNSSYGGTTYHSIINKKDFNDLLDKYNFDIISQSKVHTCSKSFLLRKKI